MEYVQPGLTRYTKRDPLQFTDLDISDTPLRSKHTDIFELRVTYMHGDADGYTKEIYSYKDKFRDKLLEHAMFLDRCIVAFPDGMGGDDGYWKVDGYKEFGEDRIPPDSEHCDGHATVKSFGVVYIDGNGTEYPVTLK